MAKVNFSKQYIRPNPLEVDYWVDLDDNPYGAVIKYYNGEDWVQLNGSGGSVSDFDFYTKAQINQMLANKANVGDVDSKVDDSELAEVIKNIQIKEIGNEGIALVLFKYDNTNLAISLPTATATNPGILAGSDFVNFVKQNQLQALYSEMYDLFADIRSKYQLKLTAGNNIVIDKINNTISVADDIKVDWDRVRSKPNFHEVSTTGDYRDLKNKLTAGIGIEIDSNNNINAVPDIELYLIVDKLPAVNIDTSKIYILVHRSSGQNSYTEYAYVEEKWKKLRTYKSSVDLDGFITKEELEQTYVSKEELEQVIDDVNGNTQQAIDIANNAVDLAEEAIDVSYNFSQIASEAKTIANAAKDAIASLEGLQNVDTSTIVAANVVTQVSENTRQIQAILANEILLTEEEYDALETKDPTVKYYIYE